MARCQRDGAIELGVMGLVDDAHPAFTKLFENLVVRDGRPDHDDLLSEGRQHLQRKQHQCVGRNKQHHKATAVQLERQMAEVFCEVLR